MKSDGSVIIDTKIGTDGMEKGFEAIKKEMGSVGVSAENLGKKLRLSLSGDVSAPIRDAFTKVKELESKLASTTAEFNAAVDDNDDRAAEKLAAKRASIYDRLETARRRLASVVANEAKKEAAAEQKAAQKALKEKERAYKKATKSARAFGKRLTSILAGALVFNVISQGLREVTQYFGKALRSNQKFSDAFNKLKGSALTAIQPIYEVLLPVLTTAIELAAKLALLLGRAFSSLAGKGSDQMKENAAALYDQANATEDAGNAAKKAKKQLAGFDELNVMGSDEPAGGASSKIANFETQDIDLNSKLGEMAALASAAIFALGIILTLSGVNIPLGLGMIVLGGLALYQSIAENWGSIESNVISTADAIALAGGAVVLAIGIILAFSGANIPLGIGLIIGGAAILGTAVALNWNAISDALRGPIGTITAIVSGALLVLGVILLFVGMIPLGIGLVVAGAAGMVAVVAVNWNAIVTKVKGTFNSIIEWIEAHGFTMLILGIVLLFTGFAIPIGLALIGLGVKGMVTGKDPLWNVILDKIKEVWGKIKNFWNTHIAKVFTGKFWSDLAKKCGNGLISGFESAVNGIISLFETMINFIVRALNKISIDVPDWIPGIGGKKFGFNIPEAKFKRLSIPRLAQGAVIPPNKEFMAVLGDQRHGTNVEAPLSTIQEAVANVMNENLAAMMAGFEALLQENRELRRTVEGIELGDSTIGQASGRYNAKMAIMRGV